jgi:hypothetical protein
MLTRCEVQEAKSQVKKYFTQRCAEGFISGFKGLNTINRINFKLYMSCVLCEVPDETIRRNITLSDKSHRVALNISRDIRESSARRN